MSKDEGRMDEGRMDETSIFIMCPFAEDGTPDLDNAAWFGSRESAEEAAREADRADLEAGVKVPPAVVFAAAL